MCTDCGGRVEPRRVCLLPLLLLETLPWAPLESVPRFTGCCILPSMAVAAPRRPVAHGPRSPTLSDARMILPVVFEADNSGRAESPALYHQRPPSLSALYTAAAPLNRHRSAQAQHPTSPPLSARSSRSTLRSMGSSRASVRDDVLASSPTIEHALASQGQPPYDAWPAHAHRRLSSASSSVHSDDLDNWPGFDSHATFADGRASQLPNQRYHSSPESDMGDERWPHERSSGSDEDDGPYSSAALSRRAEIILANAKKRLNVRLLRASVPPCHMLTGTGHGRQPARRPRVPRCLAYVQRIEQSDGHCTAHFCDKRAGPTAVFWHRSHSPTHPLAASLPAGHVHQHQHQLWPLARFE